MEDRNEKLSEKQFIVLKQLASEEDATIDVNEADYDSSFKNKVRNIVLLRSKTRVLHSTTLGYLDMKVKERSRILNMTLNPPTIRVVNMANLSAVGKFHIQTASFSSEGQYIKGKFNIEGKKSSSFELRDIRNIEVLTESEAKNFVAKLGWGTAALVALGTVFSGGLGLLGAGAAILASGNDKTITALITLFGNKQAIVSMPEKVFIEVKASFL